MVEWYIYPLIWFFFIELDKVYDMYVVRKGGGEGVIKLYSGQLLFCQNFIIIQCLFFQVYFYLFLYVFISYVAINLSTFFLPTPFSRKNFFYSIIRKKNIKKN